MKTLALEAPDDGSVTAFVTGRAGDEAFAAGLSLRPGRIGRTGLEYTVNDLTFGYEIIRDAGSGRSPEARNER